MSNEINKIKTLSQYIGGSKTELYPKTLMEAIVDQNGESLELVIQTSIDDSLTKFVNGELSMSFVKRNEVYTKTEIDDKFNNIDLSGYATLSQLNNKADKGHRHDDIYADIDHIHSGYATLAQLNTKADKEHNHDDTYAFSEHTHTEYLTEKELEDYNEEIKQEIVGDVIDDLNTLEKIAFAINNDIQFYKTVENKLEKKLDSSELEDILIDYAPSVHDHDDDYYTKDKVYNKTEIEDLLLNLDEGLDLDSYAKIDYVKEEIKRIDDNLDINYMTTEEVTYILDGKVDKESGKGLTTEDFTTEFKNKLEGIEDNANYYEHPDHHSVDIITGLHTVAKSGNYNDLNDIPTSLSQFDNDCDFITESDLDSELNSIAKNIETIDGKITANTELIESTRLDLETEIDNEIEKVNKRIDEEILGADIDFSDIFTTIENNKTELDNRITNEVSTINKRIDDTEIEINSLIESTRTEIETEIDNNIKEIDESIKEIYGGSSAKQELESYGLGNLLSFAASINYDPNFKEYVDEKISNSDSSIDEFKETIEEIYGGESAKETLTSHNLESLLKIAESLDYNPNFKDYVDTEIIDSTSSISSKIDDVENSITKDIEEIYGGESAKDTVASYNLGDLLSIANAINNDPDFHNTIDSQIETLENKHKDDIKEIYGGDNAKDVLESHNLDSLLKIAESLDYNPDFKQYVDDLCTDSNNSSLIEFRSTINEIYGGASAKDQLVGFNLESLLKIANAINNDCNFYNTIQSEIDTKGDEILSESSKNTDKRIQEIIDSAPDVLDTLREIAGALNNDPDFANTLINTITNVENLIENLKGGDISDSSLDTIVKIVNRVNEMNETLITIANEVTGSKTDIANIEKNITSINELVSSQNDLITANSSEITNIKNDVKDVEDDIKEINTTLISHSDSILAHSTEIESIQENIKDLKTIKENITTINNTLITHDESIAGIVNDVIGLNNSIDGLEEDIKAISKDFDNIVTQDIVEGMISDAKSELRGGVVDSWNTMKKIKEGTESIQNSLNEIIEANKNEAERNLQTAVSDLQEDIDNIDKAYKEEDTAIRSEISSSETALRSYINSSITNLVNNAGEGYKTLGEIESSISSALNEVSSNSSNQITNYIKQIYGVTDLDSISSISVNTISDISDQLTVLNDLITGGDDELGNLTTKISDMEKSLDELDSTLTAHNTDSENKFSSIESSITSINDKDTGILKKANDYTDDMLTSLNGTIDSLSKDINDLDKIASDNKGRLDALEEANSNLGTSILEEAKSYAREQDRINLELAKNFATEQVTSFGESIMGELSEIETGLASVRTTANNNKDKIEELEITVGECNGKSNEYTNEQIKKLVGTLENSEFGTLEGIEDNFNSLNTSLTNKINNSDKNLNDFKTYYEKDKSDIEALISGLSNTHSTDYSKLNNSITSLQGKDGELDARTIILEEYIENNDIVIKNINKNITEIKEKLGEYESLDLALKDAVGEAKEYTDGRVESLIGTTVKDEFKTLAGIEFAFTELSEKLISDINGINTSITTLQNKDKDIDAHIELVSEYMETTDNSISAINGEIINIKKQLTGYDETLQQSLGTTLNDAKKYTDTEVGKLRDSVTNSITDLESNINLISETHSSDISKVNGEIKSLQEKDTEIEGQIATISSDIVTNKNYLDGKIEEIIGDADSQSTDMNLYGISNRLDLLEEEIIDLSQDTGNLVKIYGTSLTESFQYDSVKKLSDAIAEDGEFYNTMIGLDNDVLSQANRYADSKLSNVDDKIDEIKGEVVEYNTLKKLEDQINVLKEKEEDTNTGITTMQSQISDLIAENELLKQENKALQEEIDTIYGGGESSSFNNIKKINNRLSSLNINIIGASSTANANKTNISLLREEIELIKRHLGIEESE